MLLKDIYNIFGTTPADNSKEALICHEKEWWFGVHNDHRSILVCSGLRAPQLRIRPGPCPISGDRAKIIIIRLKIKLSFCPVEDPGYEYSHHIVVMIRLEKGVVHNICINRTFCFIFLIVVKYSSADLLRVEITRET